MLQRLPVFLEESRQNHTSIVQIRSATLGILPQRNVVESITSLFGNYVDRRLQFPRFRAFQFDFDFDFRNITRKSRYIHIEGCFPEDNPFESPLVTQVLQWDCLQVWRIVPTNHVG